MTPTGLVIVTIQVDVEATFYETGDFGWAVLKQARVSAGYNLLPLLKV
jgi:hypothetical protein